tara:strand:+ start:2356 stop:2466 length:111 start_codon:yes stop_codon:yes gene_type:complete
MRLRDLKLRERHDYAPEELELGAAAQVWTDQPGREN